MGPRSTFIHDFVAVDRPFTDVLASLWDVLSEERTRSLVERAWLTESSALADDIGPAAVVCAASRPDVDVVLGAPRVRPGATIVPVAWRSLRADDACPALDADLEFASFGANRTHLHLYGRSPLRDPAGSADASMNGRIAVAVVRRFLTELADVITAAGIVDTPAGRLLRARSPGD